MKDLCVEKKSRNLYLDFLKATAILLVIIGHAIQMGSGDNYLQNGSFFNNVLFKIIYSFHMPLFMLVSGYLFAFSVKKATCSVVVLRKIKALVIPILVWSFIKLLLWKNPLHPFPHLVQAYSTAIARYLWFLWAVFICSVIVALVRRFFNDNLLVYLAIFLLSFFIPESYNSFLTVFMYPYFVFGYLYSKSYTKQPYSRSKHLFITLASAILYLVLMYFFDVNSYIYTTHIYLFRTNAPLNQLMIDLYRYAVGFVGCVFVISLTYGVYNRLSSKVRQALSWIGMETLGIYIISGNLFEHVISPLTASLPGLHYPLMFLESLCVLVVSLLLTKIIKAIPIVNTLLLGLPLHTSSKQIRNS